MSGFQETSQFAFVPALEAAFDDIRTELTALGESDFIESPDSLTTVRDGYNETGWHYFDLYGDSGNFKANRERCPRTAQACSSVPGMQNAGFSLFRPGTHLYPHRGEIDGVLRCHLPIQVPSGDLGIRFGEEVRVWQPGRCLIINDSFEHTAWNRTAGNRVVLLVTFAI